MTHLYPLSIMFLSILRDSVDLPCPGLPPIIVISPLVKPPDILSNEGYPIGIRFLSLFLMLSIVSIIALLISKCFCGCKSINALIVVCVLFNTSYAFPLERYALFCML